MIQLLTWTETYALDQDRIDRVLNKLLHFQLKFLQIQVENKVAVRLTFEDILQTNQNNDHF